MSYNSVKELMIAICDEVRRLTGTGSLIPHIEIPERLKGVGEGAGDYKIQIKLVKKGTDILIYDVINISGPDSMSWSFPLPEISGYRPVGNIDTVSDIVDGDKVIIVEFTGSASEGLIYTIVTEDERTYARLGTDTSTQNNAYGTCTDTDIIIAEEYEGNKVEQIGKNAFLNNKNITSVFVPDTVSLIKDSAFNGCTSLSSVNIPPETALGLLCFRNCTALKSIYINKGVYFNNTTTNGPFYGSGLSEISFAPDVTEIPPRLFIYCKNLTSLIIPDYILTIGESAFNNCTALENVTLPTNAELNMNVFYGCSALKTIHIPKGIIYTGSMYGPFNASGLETVTFDNDATVIQKSILYGAKSLNNVNIPASVDEIEQAAFNGCTSLSSVTIPPSVSIFGAYAFQNCPIAGTITLGGVGHPVISIGSNAFKNTTTTNITVYVEDGITSLKNQPWGASAASVTYRSALTGEIINA